MSSDPSLRQEVYGDGDTVTGNSLEPGGWSLSDDAHKPGRIWSGRSFFLNPNYEPTDIHRMFAKCHEDFSTDPLNTSYLIVIPYKESSSYLKQYGKYYEKVVIYPQGSMLYTARADTTYDSANLTPAGDAGGAHRVFVSGTPWPVVVLYRDAHTIPEVDPVLKRLGRGPGA